MADAADDLVRSAAMAKVRYLRELHGGRIPRTALMEGITLDGTRIPIFNYQKGIFKPAVLGSKGAALTIQTSADSPYGDVHDLESGHIVYKYRGMDPRHPDNASLRQAYLTNQPQTYL